MSDGSGLYEASSANRFLYELEGWLEGKREKISENCFVFKSDDAVINSLYPVAEEDELAESTEYRRPSRIGLKVISPKQMVTLKVSLGIIGFKDTDHLAYALQETSFSCLVDCALLEKNDKTINDAMAEAIESAKSRLQSNGYSVTDSLPNLCLRTKIKKIPDGHDVAVIFENLEIDMLEKTKHGANTVPPAAIYQQKIARAVKLELGIEENSKLLDFDHRVSSFSYRSNPEVKARGICTGVLQSSSNVARTSDLQVFVEKRLLLKDIPDLKLDENKCLSFDSLCDKNTTLETCEVLISGILKNAEKRKADLKRLFSKFESHPMREQLEQEFNEDVGRIDFEMKALAGGVNVLRNNTTAMNAFNFLNKSMLQRSNKLSKITGWRPFQLAFILSSLSSLLEKNGSVITLNFPTGTGKTEAFLGLSIFLAFYDRLSGKKAGTSVIIKYPRKFLSAQQLERTVEIITFSNLILKDVMPEGNRDLISTGILIGQSETPNDIWGFKRTKEGKWGNGFNEKYLAFASNANRLINIKKCPVCKSPITVTAAKEKHRLLHLCSNVDCEMRNLNCIYERQPGELPLFLIDEEVFRYLPTIVIMTLDKFATLGRNQDVKKLFMPDRLQLNSRYGFYFREHLSHDGETPTQADVIKAGRDTLGGKLGATPPSLLIVDEIHLISGSYASVAAPYEAIFLELCSLGGKRPLIICSSATVNNSKIGAKRLYQVHVEQLFAADIDKIRLFPADLGTYLQEYSDIHRYLCAIMPSEKSDIYAFQLTSEFIINKIRENGMQPDESMVLNYFTSKDNLARVAFSVEDKVISNRLSLRRNQYEIIQVTADDPQEVGRFQEAAYALSDLKRRRLPADRVRFAFATSTVANGIDFESLNLIQFFRLPTLISEYVQARSRIARGRNSCGMSLLILNHYLEREASFFTSFKETHNSTEFLLEPSPINKRTYEVMEKIIPGVFHLILFTQYDVRPERRIYLMKETKAILDDARILADIKEKIRRALAVSEEQNSDFEMAFETFIAFYKSALSDSRLGRENLIFSLGVGITRNQGKLDRLRDRDFSEFQRVGILGELRNKLEKKEGRPINIGNLLGLLSLRDVSEGVLISLKNDEIATVRGFDRIPLWNVDEDEEDPSVNGSDTS
ncbi:MAG: DEAD/DEAH box helicase [Candidatus Micrarchaeia archaeon]